MRSPISPWLTEIYCRFFPRFWIRYVDDTFFIIKKHLLRSFIYTLARQDVNFTYEVENQGRLPFLDVMVIRDDSGNIEFDIYGKPTNTQRYKTSMSQHTHQHKMAAFNSMIHRILTLPLTDERRTREQQLIVETANVNGYREKMTRRDHPNQFSTMFDKEKKDNKKLLVVQYHPLVNRDL